MFDPYDVNVLDGSEVVIPCRQSDDVTMTYGVVEDMVPHDVIDDVPLSDASDDDDRSRSTRSNTIVTNMNSTMLSSIASDDEDTVNFTPDGPGIVQPVIKPQQPVIKPPQPVIKPPQPVRRPPQVSLPTAPRVESRAPRPRHMSEGVLPQRTPGSRESKRRPMPVRPPVMPATSQSAVPPSQSAVPPSQSAAASVSPNARRPPPAKPLPSFVK